MNNYCFTVNISWYQSGIWFSILVKASLLAQLVKNLPAMGDTWVQPLGWVDPLDKGKATHYCVLAWRIPWIKDKIFLDVAFDNRLWHTQTKLILLLQKLPPHQGI